MTNDLVPALSEPGAPTSQRRRIVAHPIVQALVVFLCAVAVSGPLLVSRIQDNPGISPQDELSYIDTLVRVQNGQLVMHKGDTIDEETLQELGCRGVSSSALIPDAQVCEGGRSEVLFYNTADIDPPLYHWTVAALSWVPFELGLTSNMITAARLLGVLWCSLTMTMIFFLARRLGARVPAAAVAATTVLWLSATSIQFQYVTPHSTGMLVGAVVSLIVLSRLQGRVGWWWVTAAGLLAATTKLTNLVIVMAAATAFLIAYLWHSPDGEPRPKQRLWDTLNIGLTSVAATGAWVVIRSLSASSDVEPYEWAVVESITPAQVLENVAAFVSPLGFGYARGFAVLLSVAVFGTATWLLFRKDSVPEHRVLAGGVLAAGTLAPVALVLMNFVVTSYYVPTQGRYGLSLLPLGVALASAHLRNRTATIVAVAVTVICLWLAWYEPATLMGS